MFWLQKCLKTTKRVVLRIAGELRLENEDLLELGPGPEKGFPGCLAGDGEQRGSNC